MFLPEKSWTDGLPFLGVAKGQSWLKWIRTYAPMFSSSKSQIKTLSEDWDGFTCVFVTKNDNEKKKLL